MIWFTTYASLLLVNARFRNEMYVSDIFILEKNMHLCMNYSGHVLILSEIKHC